MLLSELVSSNMSVFAAADLLLLCIRSLIQKFALPPLSADHVNGVAVMRLNFCAFKLCALLRAPSLVSY